MTENPTGFPSLSGLAARFSLNREQADRLRQFGTILVEDEHAPTTVRDPERVRDDHLADALVGLELSVLREASTVADLGAGAGVPGIPIAIALPGTAMTLVEGNGRKCEFIRRVAAGLGLGNVEVVHGRAETWSEGRDQMDVITARALAPLDVVAEYAAPLLRPGGALVAWRGKHDPRDEAAGARAAELLGLTVRAPRWVEPYAGAQNRYLHVMIKTAPTPDRFPRRDGVARKRPLGRR